MQKDKLRRINKDNILTASLREAFSFYYGKN